MAKTSADDAHLEWVKPSRTGREAGCWVYIDAFTLKEALAKASLPVDTKPEDLIVLRKTMAHGCAADCRRKHKHHRSSGRAQVQLIFRTAAIPEVAP